MIEWEYQFRHVMAVDLQPTLNEWGREGWEYVQAFTAPDFDPRKDGDMLVVMKRPKTP